MQQALLGMLSIAEHQTLPPGLKHLTSKHDSPCFSRCSMTISSLHYDSSTCSKIYSLAPPKIDCKLHPRLRSWSCVDHDPRRRVQKCAEQKLWTWQAFLLLCTRAALTVTVEVAKVPVQLSRIRALSNCTLECNTINTSTAEVFPRSAVQKNHPSSLQTS